MTRVNSRLAGLASLLAAVAGAETPWTVDRTVDGMTLERREVAGSPFEELRVTTTTPLGLSALCDAVWAKGMTVKRLGGNIKKRVVIRETDDERWTYDQVKVSVVTDRDYVLHFKLEKPASSGRCAVSFETVTDPAYPPVSDHVRITNIRGSWEFVPEGERVRITYLVYSDPGGGVPAVFARGGQRDAAIGLVKVILARATAVPPG